MGESLDRGQVRVSALSNPFTTRPSETLTFACCLSSWSAAGVTSVPSDGTDKQLREGRNRVKAGQGLGGEVGDYPRGLKLPSSDASLECYIHQAGFRGAGPRTASEPSTYEGHRLRPKATRELLVIFGAR